MPNPSSGPDRWLWEYLRIGRSATNHGHVKFKPDENLSPTLLCYRRNLRQFASDLFEGRLLRRLDVWMTDENADADLAFDVIGLARVGIDGQPIGGLRVNLIRVLAR